MNIETIKKLFTKANLYYAGTIICAITTLVFVALLYSSNNQKNMQASLILADTEGILSEVDTQQVRISNQLSEYLSMLPDNFQVITRPNVRLNDLTRYFDAIEQEYRQSGAFRINSINYGSLNDPNFVDATLSLETTQDNLLRLLNHIESTGFNNSATRYLLELINISFSVPQTTDQDLTFENFFTQNANQNLVYTVSLQLRIYRFQTNLTSTE